MIAIAFSMMFKNPIYLVSIVAVSIMMNILLDEGKQLKGRYKPFLVMALIITIMNPVFSSRGETILIYIFNRVITLESIIYGVLFALSLLSILIYFLAYNEVITPTKFLFLFSKISPKVAFIVTVTMRFIPLFTRRLKEIAGVQKTLGYFDKSLSKKERMKESMETLNTLVSWTLEESLEGAASMRARGYGAFKRSSAVRYTFEKRDFVVMGIMAITLLISVGGYLIGYGKFEVYPTFSKITFTLYDIVHYLGVIGFLSIPIAIEIRELLRWQTIK